jgi:hypothetical protein
MRTVRFAADLEAVKAPSCSLSPGLMRERGAEWTALRAAHLIDRQRMAESVTSHWRLAALAELQRLVEAEHACCPFFAFELTVGDRSITLRTTFPAELDQELFSGVG